MCFQGIIWAHLNTTALYISIIHTYAFCHSTMQTFCQKFTKQDLKRISHRIFYKKLRSLHFTIFVPNTGCPEANMNFWDSPQSI